MSFVERRIINIRMSTARKREVNYDFMRVLMSLFVICIHIELPKSISENELLYCLITSFLFQCNGVFFMLSGKFNLRKTFGSKNDYISYYINKFISILVPYGIVSCILVLFEILLNKWECNLNGYIYRCIEAFFSTNANNHLWFLCNLIGMIVSAPFLAKMVTNMKDFELKILFIVGIVWSILAIYLTTDMGIMFSIRGWFLSEWLYIFFLGYFCDRVIDNTNIKFIYCFGIIGFIITIVGRLFLENFANATDVSAGFIVFTMSCYLFYERHIVIKNRMISKAVVYMGKYSFLAYMFHWIIIHSITKKYFLPSSGIVQYILCVIATFILSYFASISVSEVLVKPVQKILTYFLNKIWRK